MTKTTEWDMEPEGFIKAVENDEYGQITLETGDTLITDWEGDGTFHPYVQPHADHGENHPTDILDDVASAIEETFDVTVQSIEWDNTNDVFVPYMDRPTDTR